MFDMIATLCKNVKGMPTWQFGFPNKVLLWTGTFE